MTYRNLKWWLDQMEGDELDRQLTPYLLMDAVDHRLASEYDNFLAWMAVFAHKESIRDEALKLLILLNIPIRG